MRLSRWNGAAAASVAAFALALATGSPNYLLAALVPPVYVLAGALSAAPEPTLSVSRSLSATSPVPGETVEVTLTVENTGESPLPDLRVVDGVPDELAVVDGSPRSATALAAGETTAFAYSIAARRGEHEFGDVAVRSRGLAATSVRTASVRAEGDGAVACRLGVDDPPIRRRTELRAGQLTSDAGGSGVEFHATREYRPGDPMARVHWRQLAKTGDLVTVEYREPRATTVVFVVDDRPTAAVAAGEARPPAIEYATYAALRGVDVLLGAGNRVGVASLSGDRWVAPASDRDVRVRAREALLALADDVLAAAEAGAATGATPTGSDAEATGDSPTADADSPAGVAADGGAPDLRERLPANAQVVFLSPLLDDDPLDLLATLAAAGHPTTVVSPDVTDGESVGARLERTGRSLRLDSLRGRGVRTVDWTPTDPLAASIARASRRWSQ